MAITMNIRRGTYKFGTPQGETGWVLAYNEEECECCSAIMLAANSIKVDHIGAQRLGLVLTAETPEEGGYSEEFGGSTCLGCYDHTAPCTAS